VLFGLATAQATEDVKLTFSKPTNDEAEEVTIYFTPGKDVSVTIPADTSATGKRDLIKEALMDNGYDVTTEDENGDELPGNQLRVLYLRNGTRVTFSLRKTGEKEDEVVSAAAVEGTIAFANVFEPLDPNGAPATFTGGIVTDLGELTVEVSAEELSYMTEGPVICQALFDQLAPQVPTYGAEIVYAGDHLQLFFDPAYTIGPSGVIFGTSSLSEGCLGELVSAGMSCLEDLDDDGTVGLSDLTELLAAYGTAEEDPDYNQRADLDGDGVIGLDDLSALLSAYGTTCE
jgi:hypothetical protein